MAGRAPHHQRPHAVRSHVAERHGDDRSVDSAGHQSWPISTVAIGSDPKKGEEAASIDYPATSNDVRAFRMMWLPTEAIPIVAALVVVGRAVARWIDAC